MAEIRSYIKEKEKRERKKTDYKKKIVLHKLTFFYRILLAAVAAAALIVFFTVQYKNHVYTGYDIISSVERTDVTGASDVRLGSGILTYSKDGAHFTDFRGNVTWNRTFEIQDVKLASCGNTVAIGDYNGRSIYVADTEKILGEITTTMPIRNLTVSENGYVTAVLADTNITWINTYDSSGELKREGRTHMDDSGYPMALSLSPDGELLCVAYVYVDAGVLKTNMAFYNFGAVGNNVSDLLVSTWSYTDLLVPYVKFISNNMAFAVGDSRLMIFSGEHAPVSRAEHLYDREIRGVFHDNRYIGLVFFADNNDSRYQMKIYDTAAYEEDISAYREKDIYFDLDYTDIFFDGDNVVIYNEAECLILTVDGREKFQGNFSDTVRLMFPTGNSYRYVLITDDSADTIQLK